jgi:hypothetical protein
MAFNMRLILTSDQLRYTDLYEIYFAIGKRQMVSPILILCLLLFKRSVEVERYLPER